MSWRAGEAERSDRCTLIEEEAGESDKRGLNTLCEVVWELTTSHVVQSIFSIQLSMPFWEKRAPLRSRGRRGIFNENESPTKIGWDPMSGDSLKCAGECKPPRFPLPIIFAVPSLMTRMGDRVSHAS